MPHSETEPLAGLTEVGGGLPLDGIWATAAPLEHAARMWMSEFMEPGEQSVGALVSIEQMLPRPSAHTVTATAILTEIRGRRYVFDVEIHNESGELLATGRNERAVISVPPSG
jgi:fluoroacetyl-CoA thioesterase